MVENRAGSGGNIATGPAITSTPDGYTLLFSGANNAISASLYKKLPFDFIRDTVPVAMFMQVPNMLVVSNAMPVKTVQEFIDYCKANPGKLSYASSGNGTTLHMSAELFKAMTKCDMLHVPYRGSAAAFPDVISNKVQLIFDNLPTRWRRRGRHACARSASPRRSAGPACPTFPRSPRPCRDLRRRFSTACPRRRARRPKSSDLLNKAVNEALKDPKLVARFADPRRHAEADDAGRIRQTDRRRDREMAQGGGVRRRFGGVRSISPLARPNDISTLVVRRGLFDSNSQSFIRCSFTISPRIARELSKTPASPKRGRRECRAPDAPDSRVCHECGKTTRVGQVTPEIARAFPAQWF